MINKYEKYVDGMEAIYSDLTSKSYDNRPWLHAQMPISHPEDIRREMERRNRYFDAKWREEDSASRRGHLEQQAIEYFVPRQAHVELAQMLQEKLVARYRDMDISAPGFFTPQYRPPTGYGARNLVISGDSGTGKSSAIRAAASLCPQVIVHSEYKGKPFTMKQVSYVRVIAPVRAGAKALFTSICTALNGALGVSRSVSGSEDALASKIGHDAKTMGLGFLIIDETQNILKQRQNLQGTTLDAFTRLNELSGLPLIFVGTPEVKEVFNSTMHSARRCMIIDWKKVQSKEWNTWLEGVLSQHLVRDPIELTGELSQFIWEFSQGLPSLVASLVTQAQRFALLNDREIVLPEDWGRAQAVLNKSVKPATDAIRLENQKKAETKRAKRTEEQKPSMAGGKSSSKTKQQSEDHVPIDPVPQLEDLLNK